MHAISGFPRAEAGTLATALVTVALLAGCAVDRPTAVTGDAGGADLSVVAAAMDAPRATGTVEIEWKGGNGRQFPPGEAKLAFAQFEGFQLLPDGQGARGSFSFRVLNPDSSLHREIEADVTGVVIDLAARKAWMIADVIADTKQCGSGGGCDGHDGGTGSSGGCTDCGGDTGHDGGCSGSDGGTHDDGGCSGSDGGTHDAGGCSGSDGTTHTDGGCSGSNGTTHTDGGCTGSDGTSHDGGCAGGGGGGGIHVSGSGSRVGQVLVIKMHDGGTPGAAGDGITWKWFAGEDPALPRITDLASWPHLCKKTILAGNLMIHDPPLR